MIQTVDLNEIGERPKIEAVERPAASRSDENGQGLGIFMWEQLPQFLSHQAHPRLHFERPKAGREPQEKVPIKGRIVGADGR